MSKKEKKKTTKKTTKTTTTKKKSDTNKELQELKKKLEKLEQENKKLKTKKEKEVQLHDKVEIVSNINGIVGFTKANGRTVELERIGHRTKVTVDDLEHLMSTAPAMIEHGMIYIPDKNVRDFLGVEDLYKNGVVVKYSELEKILDLDYSKMKEAIDKLPKPTKRELAYVANAKVDELPLKVVKLLDEENILTLLYG